LEPSGVSVVEHIATISMNSSDPKEVIPPTIKSLTSILESCLKQPSVKHFVLTSYPWAAVRAKVNVEIQIDQDTWNEDDIKAAWNPELASSPGFNWVVYAASKVEAEKALWKFRDEKKPSFAINAILPATNFGPVLHPNEVTSTGSFIKLIWDGKLNYLAEVLPRKSIHGALKS